MPRVLVIGDVMTDIVVRPDGPIAYGADRRAAIRALPGGSGANQACWLASEGVTVRFAARVGAEDRARQKLLLAGYGVDARLAADPSYPTGSLITLLSPDGERSFLTDRAANLNLSSANLPVSLLEGVDLVHVSGYAFFEAGPREAVLGFLEEVRRRMLPFSVDPASHSFLEEVGVDSFRAWTEGARFLFPNEDEAKVLTGKGEWGGQLDSLASAYPVVALKRGKEGAAVADAASGRRFMVSAPAVAAIDSSGAGDAFLGGFLGACLRGKGIEASLSRGVELGSRAVTALGARPPAQRSIDRPA